MLSNIPLTTGAFDVIIVGAGPAGCAAAYDLARAGRRVLLLDKRSFPRHKACACGLTRKTLKALRYTVDSVLERRCREVVLQEAGPAFHHGRRVAAKDHEVRLCLHEPFCAMAVRERFDDFCLQQTLAAGAEFLKIEGLLALREFAGHVEADIQLANGQTQTLHAPVLLGADGANGQTRRLAAGLAQQRSTRSAETPSTESQALATSAQTLPPEPAWYARGFALEATVPYAVLPSVLPAGDAPLDLVFDFSPISGGYGWLFPKGDHINIGVGGFVPQGTQPKGSEPPAERDTMLYEAVTRSLLAQYSQTKLGLDLLQLPGAHITGQYLGLGGHAYKPEGRVLLTGDAAGLIDPLTGEGIHSAIVSGQAAASAILASQSHSPALAEAYALALKPLQETLTFSHRAARSFYREPERGFKVMRTPVLRSLVLKTYADGLPATRLLSALARTAASRN